MPAANGHYSQAIEHNGVLYLSGQLPLDKDKSIPPGGIRAQTRQVLGNVEEVLIASGSSRDKVIQARIYISDIALWDDVNEVYSSFFGDHKPVRCIVPVNIMHFGALIEVEIVAVI